MFPKGEGRCGLHLNKREHREAVPIWPGRLFYRLASPGTKLTQLMFWPSPVLRCRRIQADFFSPRFAKPPFLVEKLRLGKPKKALTKIAPDSGSAMPLASWGGLP